MGVKAEVERTRGTFTEGEEEGVRLEGDFVEGLAGGGGGNNGGADLGEGEEVVGQSDWVELSVEIPGYRDDDSGTVFLGAMLTEALLADGGFARKLWINRRFHWKIYLDVCLPFPFLFFCFGNG